MQSSKTIQPSRQPWVTCATVDAIQHFAWGIGDNNPLWCDLEYAQKSRWGNLIAPPCFFYAVDETTVATGYPERRREYQSVDWVFNSVIPAATQIEASAVLIEEVMTGEHIVQIGQVDFRTSDDVQLATAITSCTRSAGPAPNTDERAELRYTGEELDKIASLILSSERQGNTKLQWESTSPGDELGTLIKGPLSIMDVVAWCAATTGVVPASTNHSEGGLTQQCATGPQLVTWISQLITDWMGDDGFLQRLKIDVNGQPPLGSTTTITGQVVTVTLEQGRPTTLIELSALDNQGTTIARGTAKVLLPSAQHGPVKLSFTA